MWIQNTGFSLTLCSNYVHTLHAYVSNRVTETRNPNELYLIRGSHLIKMLMTKSDCSTYFLSFIRCKEIKCFAYVNCMHFMRKKPATRNNQQIKNCDLNRRDVVLLDSIMVTQSFTNLHRAHRDHLTILAWNVFSPFYVNRSMALGVLKVNSRMWWFTCLFISFMFRCGGQPYFQLQFRFAMHARVHRLIVFCISMIFMFEMGMTVVLLDIVWFIAIDVLTCPMSRIVTYSCSIVAQLWLTLNPS